MVDQTFIDNHSKEKKRVCVCVSMHHLVIDVKPEEESSIEIYDPFVDEVIGSRSDSNANISLEKQEQQSLLEEEIPEMNSKKNTNLISSYNLTPIHVCTYFFKDP